MKCTYYGHSCFSLSDGTTTVQFDPFFTDNRWTHVDPATVQCQYIFLSHGHDDHYGDADLIAKHNDALVISTAEVSRKAMAAGCKAHTMHIGGTARFPFGSVCLTPALHGAGVPGGLACGCIMELGGKRIYYAGDTGLYSDMKLHSRFGPIDVAFLPIGDNFTMGPEDAALAASWIQPKLVIPIHYNTWPIIESDPYGFAELLKQKYDIPAQVIQVEDTVEL